jgi:hypothetical protein
MHELSVLWEVLEASFVQHGRVDHIWTLHFKVLKGLVVNCTACWANGAGLVHAINSYAQVSHKCNGVGMALPQTSLFYILWSCLPSCELHMWNLLRHEAICLATCLPHHPTTCFPHLHGCHNTQTLLTPNACWLLKIRCVAKRIFARCEVRIRFGIRSRGCFGVRKLV